VGQHFNTDWNGNARLSRISGVVPNLFVSIDQEKYKKYDLAYEIMYPYSRYALYIVRNSSFKIKLFLFTAVMTTRITQA